MTVFVKEKEANYVGSQSETAYNQDKLRVRDFLRFDKSLDGLKEN